VKRLFEKIRDELAETRVAEFRASEIETRVLKIFDYAFDKKVECYFLFIHPYL
jgi:hypothetical protein